MKLDSILEELIKEAEDKQQVDALDQAMGNAFKTMGSLLSQSEDELKQDVQQADIEIKESVTVVAVIGIILAAPKIIELLVKSLQGVVSVFKKMFVKKGAKTEEEQSAVAEKILDASMAVAIRQRRNSAPNDCDPAAGHSRRWSAFASAPQRNRYRRESCCGPVA